MKVFLQWLFAFVQLSVAVEAAAADSGRQDVVTLISQCEGRTRGEALAAIVQACTSAIDTKAYQGKQLGMLYLNRANVYDSMGDSSNALLDYNKAVELAPDVAGTYYNRGVYYQKSKRDFTAALKDYDSALRVDPTFVVALYNRAIIYDAQGNGSGALADYSQAIRLSPNTAELHGRRGNVYLTQGDYRNALKDEDEAIRLDPKYAVAYLYRAVAHGKLGDGDQAAEDLKTAIRLNPSLASNVGINGVRLNSGRATSAPQPEPQ
jgi:tetratricopeptide (TPR) repeat protein